MCQEAGYFNKANQRYSFLFSFEIIAWKIDQHVMLSYLLLFDKRLEFDFFLNFIQNSHVHKPSKLIENLQHLHITTENNLTSNHCLKLKSLGFSVSKYIFLTFCWNSIEA